LQCWLIAARADGTPYPGDYINKCVEQVAVTLYEEPPTVPPEEALPPPDEITMKWKNSVGEVIIIADYVKKNVG